MAGFFGSIKTKRARKCSSPTHGTHTSQGRAAPGKDAGHAPDWARQEILEFAGSATGLWARYVSAPDSRGIGTVRYPRAVPKDDACAKDLANRTLTSLYNERPAWLDLAHRKLDAAVFAAYGWDSSISDDELLAKLLALNLEHAKHE
jgi:hypothetical protein